MHANMPDLTTTAARAERDALANRTDVLDEIGALRTLPDDMHVTTEMVAEFYDTTTEVVRQVVVRNREELDTDGYVVLRRSEVSDKLSLTPDQLGMPRTSPTISLFPRRAVLRIGMLLRDSKVARQVRTYLLDGEVATVPTRSPSELTRREILVMALEAEDRADLAEARALKAEGQISELAPKAAMADDFLIADGGARLVREVAKLLGMREKDLRRFLLDEKLIFTKQAPCGAIMYDRYAQFAVHFKMMEHVVTHSRGPCTHYTLMILPRGIELIRKRLDQAGKNYSSKEIA